ncbi:MAG: hypothetical protein ACLU9S_05055 [Oscillospiraceae bacterium]
MEILNNSAVRTTLSFRLKIPFRRVRDDSPVFQIGGNFSVCTDLLLDLAHRGVNDIADVVREYLRDAFRRLVLAMA